MNEQRDTIAAIATPPGAGGIAILRISGHQALRVLHRLFSRPGGCDSATGSSFAFRPRHMHFGHALDAEGLPLDDALAVYMPGPHSATGEDVGEIHCHGGPGVTTALLDAAFAAGARLAEPGEFTKRAFLNGRMDLTQAEAVAEIVAATTGRGARLARAKLEGTLGNTVSGIARRLEACRMQIALAVDFPDEDAELLNRKAFAGTVAEARHEMGKLLAGFARARLWREGANVVLAGRVNAGKSSLFNALVGRQRAIVSSLPGTTRDYIEESLNLDGLPVRLVDTAGLRGAGDLIEEEGIRLSRELAEQADILVLVVDTQEGIRDAEHSFFIRVAAHADQGTLVIVLNKVDTLPEARQKDAVFSPALPSAFAACPVFPVSARTGFGLDALAAGIRAAALASGGGSEPDHGDIAPNLRQSRLLRQADEELAALSRDLEAGLPPDILGVRLDSAASLLAEVTGAVDNEAILNSIFSSFCIGK